MIWSAAYLILGFIFFEQLESVVGYASRMGSSLLILVVGLFALWICWKFTQRRRFLKQLNVARITPEELRDRLEAGEDLLIVDLRTRVGRRLRHDSRRCPDFCRGSDVRRAGDSTGP